MQQKHQVIRNALVSGVQAAAGAGILLVLYAFLIRTIGAEHFGVWALVTAWTSAGGVAGLGLSGGALKFTSQYLARGEMERVIGVIQTAVLSIALATGAVLLAAYPLLHAFLGALLESPQLLTDARSILPAAFASFLLLSVAGVLLGGLDGCHRMDLKGLLLVATSAAYLACCYVLVPMYGLQGLVLAQVGQNLVLVLGAWALLRRLLPALPLLPSRWERATFREMLGYSAGFQAISVFTILFEPVTKALLVRFVGIEMVTPFETANRVAIQLRSLVVSAYMAVVPAVADLQERAPEKVRAVYTGSFGLLLLGVVPAVPLAIGFAPILSRLWLGTLDPAFVRYGSLLFLGWFLNLLACPAYFAGMGTGHLRWNVWGHGVTAVANVALGLALGWLYGGTGVVVGYVAALLLGNLVMVLPYHRAHRIRSRELVGPETLALALAALIGMAVVLYLHSRFGEEWDVRVLASAALLAYAAAVALPLWRHPVRDYIFTSLLGSARGGIPFLRPRTSQDA